jgi:hypothetical protein
VNDPILVVMAAGIGSRYGGLKQIDPVGEHGELIIDYSLYDAVRAGFRRAVFVINPENEAAFRARIGDRMEQRLEVRYAHQRLDTLPEGFSVPRGRAKPWGTGHAVLCCGALIDAPFAVINADDYYGRSAFTSLYDFLKTHERQSGSLRCALVGYVLQNTLTDHGFVARGICSRGKDGRLSGITERTRVERRNGGVSYSEDGGATWSPLAPDATVSMNCWAFPAAAMDELQALFPRFLETKARENPLGAEFYLPSAVDSMMRNGAKVEILPSADRWYGVTYREDKPVVETAVRRMHEAGLYPAPLWA